MTNLHSRDHLKEISRHLLEADTEGLNIGLHAGQSGLALFLAYHARYSGEEQLLDQAMELLQDCFARMEEESTIYSLCSGVAGTAWTLAHLARHGFFEAEAEEMLAELDAFLLRMALEDIADKQYDLLHSGLGIGVYFLERWLGGDRSAALPEIIAALEQARVCDGELRTWEDKLSEQRGRVTFNLGMAHGVPSIIGFLAECQSAGVVYEGLPQLIAESVNWLMRQELPLGGCSCFATRIKDSEPEGLNSRLAWCYGDLGVAPALYSAGRALGRDDWQEAALRIVRKAAERPIEESGVKDAGFCHGTAGIAFIFNRFYRHSGEKIFKDAAQFWLEETLGWRKFDAPAGYQFWGPVKPGDTELSWIEDLTLLGGLAGLGMVYLEATYQIEEDWERCFLLS